jgi:hypothetical protein
MALPSRNRLRESHVIRKSVTRGSRGGRLEKCRRRAVTRRPPTLQQGPPLSEALCRGFRGCFVRFYPDFLVSRTGLEPVTR